MHFVDLFAQYCSIRGELDAAIRSVIEESAFIRGRHVEEFEARFAELIGARHCISCGNGTDAIFLALKSLGVSPGDEVITTAHSWIATSATITQAGGRVVFSDTEEKYFCIDPNRIEEKITSRTKGIVVVHLYGQSADMEPILAIARRYGLWVIEDCAQAHLAEYHGRRVGTMGDVGTFSFYPGKNLGAMGDAGCIVTNRDDVARFAACFAHHGGKNNHAMEGINSRMDGLQAAILNVKMRYIEEWTERRLQLAQLYNHFLAEADGVSVPRQRDGCRHVYHLYVIRFQRRDELRDALSSAKIPTLVNYPSALPYYPAYKYLEHRPDDFPVAVRHSKEIISIPIYPELTEEKVESISREIKRAAKVLRQPTRREC
jgi:dTDP-4-amino-4,6-dideoxygalactose transaminase